MGSLMAGWDSPVQDPNVVKYRRNKSLTKEEIEVFWKSKKQKEEEHLKDISLLSPRTQAAKGGALARLGVRRGKNASPRFYGRSATHVDILGVILRGGNDGVGLWIFLPFLLPHFDQRVEGRLLPAQCRKVKPQRSLKRFG
ncbi:hypothetical protein PHJA_002591500 [Phtheirospermum japonicum]|uniref:Uncharacterized protein n=1 Tax=Phtheirospermum japonicum TaxID=374723 RepID=A0A830DBQ1_9LAMI|nr:hypothetical protein PHJA_002591500 [Phtheirospermum japonicum]